MKDSNGAILNDGDSVRAIKVTSKYVKNAYFYNNWELTDLALSDPTQITLFKRLYSMVFEVILLTLVLLVALSIVYDTLKSGISPMPSSSKAYQAMVKLIDETGTGTITDMGSGWGNFVIPIAKRYPQRQIVGYELSLLPYLTSTLLKRALGLKNLTLYRKNFLNADLSTASVLVCYLFPETMEKIKNKLLLEKPEVEFLISNNFALPSWQSERMIQLNDFYRSPVYLYKLNLQTL